MLSSKVCSICGDPNCQLSDMEGYEIWCNPCACYMIDLELSVQLESELNIYKNRSGNDFDFNEFCSECYGNSDEITVKPEHLIGLPELTLSYDQGICAYKQDHTPRQRKIDFENNELPF